MTVSAADVRTVDQLLSFILDGGQPEYLLFWGHQPPPTGGVGKGCLSQWWPAAFTVDEVAYHSAEHFMMTAKALLFGCSATPRQLSASGRHRIREQPRHWDGGRVRPEGRHCRTCRNGSDGTPMAWIDRDAVITVLGSAETFHLFPVNTMHGSPPPAQNVVIWNWDKENGRRNFLSVFE